ncbi:ribonuclease P/MRP protein subunit RPP1 [Geosmithia morbida]|uniref:Ribonuclease P/MRP protein subunit RPP1 n=1 Tax=Geosmithia morbida TaxID=1094350 RepID=A0A9P4YRD8_9HYPO|nr:ribonuclease P/MRP protein subunit RPP1 [Geosmithia morbida]KAF4121718.1 ribonuclease P/MRP protein subunit RPP1 [Geosmithia morbida]
MLYDLNIPWSPQTTRDQLIQTLTLASSLGYGTVALNHTFTQAPPSNPTAPFPKDIPDPSTGSGGSGRRFPNVLRRATLPLSDPSSSNYRLQTLVKAYDILAVRPQTERAFSNACLTLDVPLISLDMTQQLPFFLKPKTCMAAVSRGLRFEVCYAQALSPSADHRARASFIANTTALVRATRGRGIVVSSEATGPLTLRAPADVANLLSVWGLPAEKGMESLGAVPRSVVVNEGIKRSGFRGVVNIVHTVPAPPPPASKNKDATVAGTTPSSEQAQTGNNNNSSSSSSKSKKQKRKGDQTQSGNGPHNKKMRVVPREAT